MRTTCFQEAGHPFKYFLISMLILKTWMFCIKDILLYRFWATQKQPFTVAPGWQLISRKALGEMGIKGRRSFTVETKGVVMLGRKTKNTESDLKNNTLQTLSKAATPATQERKQVGCPLYFNMYQVYDYLECEWHLFVYVLCLITEWPLIYPD